MRHLALAAIFALIALIPTAPERALAQNRSDSLVEVMNYPEMRRLLQQVNQIAKPGTREGTMENRMELFGHILRQQQKNVGSDPKRQAHFSAMVRRLQEIALVSDFFGTQAADIQVPDAGQFSESDALLLGTLKQAPLFSAFQRGFGGNSTRYAQHQSRSIYLNPAAQPTLPQVLPPGGLPIAAPAAAPPNAVRTGQNWLNGTYTWKQTVYDKDSYQIYKTEHCVASVDGSKITIRYTYEDPYDKWHLDAKLTGGQVETDTNRPGWAKIFSNEAHPPLGRIDGTYTKEKTNGQTDRFTDRLDGGNKQYFEFYGPVDGVAYYGHFAADRVRWNTARQDWDRWESGVRCSFDPRLQSRPGLDIQVTATRR